MHDAEEVDVEAQQVDARERDVLRADHDRQEEVAERGGDAGDDEEEHHHRAVQREEPVVGLPVDDGLAAREELEPDEQREDAAHQEGEADHGQVHQPDALVVEREQPRPEPVRRLQVVGVRIAVRVRRVSAGHRDVDCCHGALLLFPQSFSDLM